MKGSGLLHSLFRAGIEMLSNCSLHTNFSERNQRGDNFGSGGSDVRGTSTSSILSSSKSTEAFSPFVLHGPDTGSESDRAF